MCLLHEPFQNNLDLPAARQTCIKNIPEYILKDKCSRIYYGKKYSSIYLRKQQKKILEYNLEKKTIFFHNLFWKKISWKFYRKKSRLKKSR